MSYYIILSYGLPVKLSINLPTARAGKMSEALLTFNKRIFHHETRFKVGED